MSFPKSPIGIFDSGVGGLTVFKEIRKAFPHDDIIYFGDTARVPYGSKSPETVIEYSIQNAKFLLDAGVKVIVVACNTSSAMALKTLQKKTDIPVIGVIEAGAETAVNATKFGKIGVIGTEGTISSQAYKKAIKRLNKKIYVTEKACPLFVPLAEEGWHDNHITRQIVEIYLKDILTQEIDTLVLGCTHYPILKATIQDVCGEKIQLIDSAEAIARHLQSIITPEPKKSLGINYFYVSDNKKKFARVAMEIMNIEEFYIDLVKLEFKDRRKK